MGRLRYGFEDPRQAEIYARLRELIGPGPASFYKDACRIMAAEEPMTAATHLVGHCIREIESALRAVLKPAVGAHAATQEKRSEQESARKKQGTKKDNHKREIRAILGGLGMSEDGLVAQAWDRYAEQLHEWAHRHALNPPRPLDREFEDFFNGMERVLETVLARFETRFGSSFALIDELVANDHPQDTDADQLLQRIPNTLVTYNRFFEGIPDGRWLPPLRRKDFFLRPPEPEVDEDGNTAYPFWPQSAYLARVATEEPQQVKEIVLRMQPTTNVRVLEDVADAALAMSPRLSLEVLPRVVEGLDLPAFAPRLPHKLAALVVHLSNGGLCSEALGLARELLVLVSKEERPDHSGYDALAAVLDLKARPRFDPPELYDQVVDEVLQPLIDAAGEETFEMLCDLFAGAIRASVYLTDEGEDLPYEDNVYVYRPAIEDHRYNRNFGTRGEAAMYRLLSAVRDTAEQLVAAEPARLGALVTALEERGIQTFDRLALYLLHKFPEAPNAQELAAERLTANIATLCPPLWHEYALLLRTTFAELFPEAQREILNAIEAGPPEEELEEVREYRSTNSDPPLSDAELEESLQRFINIWKLRRLAMLGDELLPATQREEYERLFEQHGDPRSDPLFYNEPRVRSVPLEGSPVSADDMREMEVEEIVAFLHDFVPTTKREETDLMEVAHELKDAVKSDPARFAREAEAFQDLEPTYVRGLLWGLHEYLREANKDEESLEEPVPSFSWRPVLNLCRWILDQPRRPDETQYGSRRDLGWGLCRQWAAELLRDGLLRLGEVPFELRQEVWEVLQRLSFDPEPTVAQEEAQMSAGRPHATPNHVSINSVRGVALHGIVAYALWVRRNLTGSADDEDHDPWRSLDDDAPEVRQILDLRLDSGVEATQTVRSVYGSWLPWLVYLDRRWVEDNLTRIFPQDGREQRLRRAAWNAYITQVRADREVFEVLRPDYGRTIEYLNHAQIDQERPSPERRLAEHLMVLYWWGALQFDDPDRLLERFYDHAPDPIRAKAAGFIGHLISLQESPLPDDLRTRLEDLWERRLGGIEALVTIEEADGEADSTASHSEELAAFASWATAEEFDPRRSLERLKKGLALGADVGRSHDLTEHLAQLAPTYPNLVTECVTYVVHGILRAGPSEQWTLIVLQDDIYEALQRAIASGETEASQRAREIANILLARGYTRFESLL